MIILPNYYLNDSLAMAGNEKEVCEFIFNNLNTFKLKHLNTIHEISTPVKGSSNLKVIETVNDLSAISTQDSSKKADIYLNGTGVSIKQTGSSFAFNRIQRAEIINLYTQLGFINIQNKLSRIDTSVNQFHQSLLPTRNIPWVNFFSKQEFKKILEFLMMKGSPSKGISAHMAQYILEAPKSNINQQNMSLHSFDEYFDLYQDKLFIAIRRQWIGQSSDSEHKRALGLSKKPDNSPWVFNNVVGFPRTGWKNDFPVNQRKTVYFLMIEKKK